GGFLSLRRGGSPPSRGAVGARRSRRLLSLRDTAGPMSQENVELTRAFIEAYNRRDLERIIEMIDPTFEFRSRFVGLESVHRASEGFPRTYFEMLDDAYERFQVVLSEFIDAGSAVLAAGRAEWRGEGGGG